MKYVQPQKHTTEERRALYGIIKRFVLCAAGDLRCAPNKSDIDDARRILKNE